MSFFNHLSKKLAVSRKKSTQATPTMIKIGAPAYINALPFLYPLIEKKVSHHITHNFEFVLDHPTVINEAFKKKELDIALISASEKSAYTSQNFGIGATNKVMSVCLFAPHETELQNITTIALPTSSHASIRLLKILEREFWDQSFDYVLFTKNLPHLLIGDEALQAYEEAHYRAYDLVNEWNRATNLGFVFARWSAHSQEKLALFETLLEELLEWSKKNLTEIIDACRTRYTPQIKHQTIVDYFDCLDHRFNDSHREGLQLFTTLIEKYDLH